VLAEKNSNCGRRADAGLAGGGSEPIRSQVSMGTLILRTGHLAEIQTEHDSGSDGRSKPWCPGPPEAYRLTQPSRWGCPRDGPAGAATW